MIELRPYQVAAIHCLDAWLGARDDNPCIVIPTGGGKTVVFARIIERYLQAWPQTRILVLAHVKELIEQNARKLAEVWPQAPLGVYSAGLGRRDMTDSVIFAGIQSVYRRGAELGRFDLVFIDEAHRIPTGGEGMYRTLLADLRTTNPHLRVVGFTATPYRLGVGSVCAPNHLLNGVCYEVGVRELIDAGYLSRLMARGSKARADLTSVHVRQGEFVADELEAAMTRGDLVERTAAELCRLAADCRAWLVFCAGKQHAERMSAALAGQGIEAPVVHEGTATSERAALVRRYRAGELRALVNINVLSEGFDAPHVDCVALLRPTKSPGLYYQQVGRGLRLASGKERCLVLDFAGNVLEHGPIDALRPPRRKGQGSGPAPVKACPECELYVPASARECPECGHVWPPADPHADKASAAAVLREPPARIEVERVEYRRHEKPGKPSTLRVDYVARGAMARYSEWVCLEHEGYPRFKAEQWWRRRYPTCLVLPATVGEALDDAEAGQLAEPAAILVDFSGKYPTIVDHEFDLPPSRPIPTPPAAVNAF